MANAGTKSAGAVGTVVQVTGPVVDIEFPARKAVSCGHGDGADAIVAKVLLHLYNE